MALQNTSSSLENSAESQLLQAPSLEVRDQILFIINNMAFTDMEAKAEEFAAILHEQHYPWFAKYMTEKRASTELNLHDLYVKFLDSVNSKSLHKTILQATYEYCKALLKSEFIKSTLGRLMLKSMGSWLGKLTIGRNSVLRASQIDPKPLIIKAYEKGLLTALIPFVCKILESCESSIVYRPPNPWTTGILQLLAELHSIPGMKLIIVFEIEVLFKTLRIDMRDITPSDVLKGCEREVVGNPDFHGNIRATQPQATRDIQTAVISPLNQGQTLGDVVSQSNLAEHTGLVSQNVRPHHQSSGALMEIEKRAVFGSIHQLQSEEGLSQAGPSQSTFLGTEIFTPMSFIRDYPSINHVVSALKLDIDSHRMIERIVDKAIQEVAPDIFESSIKASSSTVNKLLVKNDSLESDQTTLLETAHLMAGTLAGNFAYVTSKEKLCISLQRDVRNLLTTLNLRSEFLELAVEIVTSTCVDLGARRIQDAAVEKAIEEADKELRHHISQQQIYELQLFEGLFGTQMANSRHSSHSPRRALQGVTILRNRHGMPNRRGAYIARR